MLRTTFLLLSLALVSPPTPCQTTEPDKAVIEALLSEIRQLRQDLRAAAADARKAQIVIYRLHVQQAVVERTSERLDSVKNELTMIESQKKYQSEQIKRFEEMKEQAKTEQEQKRFEEYICQFKTNLEQWDPKEQELQAQRIELEAELRAEQAKWERLQDELDRLENALESSTLRVSK